MEEKSVRDVECEKCQKVCGGECDSLDVFREKVKNDKAKLSQQNTFRPVDYYDLNISLFQAMISPELYRNIRFMAPFSIPTYTFQQKSSFSVNLNANGAAWISINMGQYLDASKFKTGLAGSQNGTAVVPFSNVFTDSRAALDGITPLADGSAANGMTGRNVMSILTNSFNAVRCGPMSVKYEYTGRIDNASGTVSMGI
jgi:hypothetical protein